MLLNHSARFAPTDVFVGAMVSNIIAIKFKVEKFFLRREKT
jgi:hypothetical protein